MVDKREQVNHKYYQDILRIVAIWLVMWNHSDERAFHVYAYYPEGMLRYVYMIASIICKCAVPLFFMISGSNLLCKNETTIDIYKKRVSRMVVALCINSFFYCVYRYFEYGRAFSFVDIFRNAFNGNVWVAGWYLYAYIALLMMLPMLRPMVQNMKSRDFIYVIVLNLLVLGILPTISYLFQGGGFGLTGHLNLFLITIWNSFYFMLGYWVEYKLEPSLVNIRNISILLILTVSSIALSCHMINIKLGMEGVEYTDEEFMRAFIVVPTLFLFVLSKYIMQKVHLNGCCQWTLQIMGGAVFGVYLLEQFLREKTVFIYDILVQKTNILLSSVVWISAALVLGLVIVIPLRFIPVVKKVI